MKTKGSGNGHGSASQDYTLEMRDTAAEVTTSAERIGDIAGDVTRGVDSQGRSLEGAISSANEMAASIKETALQTESAAASAEELASSTNEIAASIAQVT